LGIGGSSEPDSSEPDSSEPNSELPPIPNWDDAIYSARQISELFYNQYESVATNAYTTVFVPDDKYLPIDKIPNEGYLPLYYLNDTDESWESDQSREPDEPIGNELNEDEFRGFFSEQLPKGSDFIGMSIPEDKFTMRKLYNNELWLYYDMGSHYILLKQNENFNSFCIRGNPISIIGGETIQIDQRLSDDEIVESIQSVKNKLFEAFNVSFTDIKIVRSFDDYSTHGANYIHVYFYDKNAHLLNSLQKIPVSDYICISFDNGENASDGILTNCRITYYKMRCDIQTKYEIKSNAEIISLEEAEALLYNGCVFGGHSCTLCMAANEKVSFEGYDFVDIEYVFQTESIYNNMNLGAPFYAFYKKIGTGKNGNSIYAKTYVAAIKVRGYTAYLESQKANHKNT